jgi:MoxR-like ATPase
VACDDVAAVAPLVLRHRVIRTFHADAEGISADSIVAHVLDNVSRNGKG